MKIFSVVFLIALATNSFGRDVVDINRAMIETVKKESNEVNMDQFKKRPEMERNPASVDWERDPGTKVDKTVRQTGHNQW